MAVRVPTNAMPHSILGLVMGKPGGRMAYLRSKGDRMNVLVISPNVRGCREMSLSA